MDYYLGETEAKISSSMTKANSYVINSVLIKVLIIPELSQVFTVSDESKCRNAKFNPTVLPSWCVQFAYQSKGLLCLHHVNAST